MSELQRALIELPRPSKMHDLVATAIRLDTFIANANNEDTRTMKLNLEILRQNKKPKMKTTEEKQ